MPITLRQDFVSGNEACLSWTISDFLLMPTSKCLICLSDINQSGVNTFSTITFLIRPNDFFQGTHTFTNISAGLYHAKLMIITDNTSVTSEELSVIVYQVDTPVFETNGIISGNQKFTFIFEQPTSDMTNGTLNVILYGQSILQGDTQNTFSGIINRVFSYSSNNTYVIDGLENNVEYEITCFYSNSVNISGLVSLAQVKRPTNTPNQITELEPFYNASLRTLTVTHNLPSNASDYDLIDLRATIKDLSTNSTTYYYSSENSAALNPAPTVADNVVFNMNNQNLLPVDSPFTITLSAKNEVNLWGPQESPAIKCIHTSDFSAVPLSVNDLNFSVGVNNITITDNNTYVKNQVYDINYTASLYNSNAAGNIVGSAIETKTQTNDMNFVFSNLVTGNLYKLIFNLTYTYTFSDNTTVTIQQNVMDTCYKHFIPHTIAEQLTISATPSTQSVLVSWLDITVQELNGFILDHYEVSDDNTTWTNKGTSLSHTFIELTNGSSKTFYLRAVTNSGTTLYLSGETKDGETVSVTSIPYGNPSNLTKVSQLPEDRKCTIVWTISPSNPYNGGLFDKFEASVNSGAYATIVPSFANDQYTYEFINLNNLVSNSILIRLVNKNQPNLNNVDTIKISDNLSVVTTPYPLPAIPSNFQAAPNTTSVALSWTGVTPASIIDRAVEYELYYKLQANSDFIVVSNITTNSYIVSSLTSNSMYDFKIRSSIHNTEVNGTFYSEFTSILASRPFVYLNAPNMVLEAGNNTIIAKLTPNVNNYFQSTFKYHATVSNLDGTNSNTIILSNVTNLNQQTITFTVLGDNSGLVNLTEYKVEAYYEMLNTENNQYYTSNTVDNDIRPFNANLTAVLRSQSFSTYVLYAFITSAFAGYTINHYEYSFDNESWSDIPNMDLQSSENYFYIQNLTNGTSYDMYVRVIYEVNGEIKTSSSSNKVTNIPYTNASAPTNLSSVAASGEITLSWQAPDLLNGLGFDHYEVKIEDGDWTNVGTNLSHVFSGLTNATVYTMYVKAVTLNVLEGNVYVDGVASSIYNLPYAIPSAPTFVSCVEGNEELRLTWNINTTGTMLGGFSFAGFMGSYDNGVNWINLNNFDASKYFGDEQNPAYLFTGLTNGQSYFLKVYAVISHPLLGNIDGNVLTVGPFVPFTNPSAPIFVSCLEGNQQLTLTWEEPSSLGGLSLDHYKVRTNTNTWIDAGLNLSNIITGLTNGQAYNISIKAVVSHPNLGLQDGATYTSTVTFVPYTTAIAPTFIYSDTTINNYSWYPTRLRIQVTKLPGSSVDNVWVETVGSNTGGLPVDYYEYSYDNINWNTNYNEINDYAIVIGSGLYPSDGIGFPATEIGTTVTIKVRAVTTHPNLGSIPGTAFERNALIYATPSPPIFNTIVAGDQSLTVTWQAMVPYVSGILYESGLPIVDGQLNGLPLERYQIAVNNYGNGTHWMNVDASVTTYTFTELTNGTSYAPIIRAYGYDQYKNVGGNGTNTLVEGFIATSSANTPYKPASAPTLNAIEQQDSQLTLTWNAPALGGLSFVRYEMSIDGTTWTSSVGNVNYTNSETVPSFVFTSLTNGQSYNLRVRTITTHPVLGEITGDTFTSLSYVPYKVAAAPVITVTPSNQQVLLEWSTPDLGGLPLTSFQLSYNGTTWSDLISGSGLIFSTNNVNSSVTFTGLTNGTSYSYYIRIKTTHPNLGNINGLSTNVTAVPFIIPGVVSNVVASAINGKLTFSFTAPANANNNVITENYEYSIDEGNTWEPLYQLTDFITNIGDNMFSLKIRVYIINPNDNISKVVGGITTLNNLQNVDIVTPQNVVSSFGNGTVTLSWDVVNVPDIAYQVIQYFDNGSTTKTIITNNTYTFTGLTNGITYRFGVALYLSGAAGPVSNITVRPMIEPVINSVTKSGDVLTVNINFGGSSSVNVVLTSSNVVTINGQEYIPVDGGQQTISVTSSSNPITFSGMSAKTRFDLVVSNTVGNTNGTYSI
jgi:hypothetical protein